MHTRALMAFESSDTPHTLYYNPLPDYYKASYRQQFPMYGDTMKFLTTMVVKHGVCVENHETGESTALRVESSLRSLPETLFFEAGAAIMGWQRQTQESPQEFTARIERQLQSTYELGEMP